MAARLTVIVLSDAIIIWLLSTFFARGPLPSSRSITAKSDRLKRQLPRIFPSARFGASIETALIVVTNSGSEVARGSISAPIHAEPIPVFLETVAPLLVKVLPANTITKAHIANCNQ
jgi:hypothetical protein